jgi:hypothetical protein
MYREVLLQSDARNVAARFRMVMAVRRRAAIHEDIFRKEELRLSSDQFG